MENIGIELKDISSNKREYFRVNAVIPLVIKIIEEYLPCMKSKILSESNISKSYNDLPDETINPYLWEMLVDINTKLNTIIKKLNLDNEGNEVLENKKVNLSAAGIRLTVDEEFNIEDLVEIDLIIPGCTPVGMLLYGNVVRVDKLEKDEFEVSISFYEMDDKVRDVIIQYTLKRQQEILNKQRVTY